MFNLHIAQNGSIFEQIGNTPSNFLAPALLQAKVTETKVNPQDPEPKITLVNTFYESLAHFEEALQGSNHEPSYA